MNDTQKQEIFRQSTNIVVLGLSPDNTKPSYQVAHYLQTQGYCIVPVYPRGGEILGEKAYRSLYEALYSMQQNKKSCDIINVFRKSEVLKEVALEIIESSREVGCLPKCVWVQLGLCNMQAKSLLTQSGIWYEEDACIKIEHKRLMGFSC